MKVRFSDFSAIQMFAIQIPTVHTNSPKGKVCAIVLLRIFCGPRDPSSNPAWGKSVWTRAKGKFQANSENRELQKLRPRPTKYELSIPLCNTEYILVKFDIWSNGFFSPMVFYLFGLLVFIYLIVRFLLHGHVSKIHNITS